MRRGSLNDVMIFWLTPWSQGLREACEWMGYDPPLYGRPLKNKLAPWWIRPFFLQAWVTQAIVARLAWLKAHPGALKERFGKDGLPEWVDWEQVRWTFAEPWCLRAMSEETLLGCFWQDAERLLHIVREMPWMVGPTEWGQAVLMACGHLAQYYRELCRRHGVARAREIVQAQLRQFVTWQPEAEQTAETETPAAEDAAQV